MSVPLVLDRNDMSPEFKNVFSALRAILVRHAGKLRVTEDSATRYCLEGGRHPTHGTPMQLAWVQVGKNYVSFHHMGVYASSGLIRDASKELRARMQGKSCFNFTTVDPELFSELEEITVRGFEVFRKPPFIG